LRWCLCYAAYVDGAPLTSVEDVIVANNLISNNSFVDHDLPHGGLFYLSVGITSKNIKFINNIVLDNFQDTDDGYQIAINEVNAASSEFIIDANCLVGKKLILWNGKEYVADMLIGNESGYFSYDFGSGVKNIVDDPLLYGDKLTKLSPCLFAGIPIVVANKVFKHIGPVEEITAAKGYITIPAGDTSGDVFHGFGSTNIIVIPYSPVTFYLTDVNANGFKINIDPTDSDANFVWIVTK